MMRNRRRIGRPSRLSSRDDASVPIRVGVVLAALTLTSSAQAIEVKFPKTDPRVALEIPDNWIATYTAAGLELRSPEKNSLIVANVVKHDERAVEAWAKEAKKAMGAEGVVFAKNGKPTRTLIPKPETGASDSVVAQSQSPGEAFSFSGAPSITPNFSHGEDKFSEAIAKRKGPVTPYKVVQTFGAMFEKRPVDIELAMYALANDELFVIEQQSGQTDGRAAAIVKSYRPLP